MSRTRALLLALCVAVAADAQRAVPSGVVAPRDTVARGGGWHPTSPFERDSAWWVPLNSVLMPGLGQVRLGQNRFMAYLAVEAYSVMGYVNASTAERRERERFISLARDVARAFDPDGNTAVGNWDYYEAMKKHLESGAFTRNATGEVAPELDTTTYNGSIWLLARQISGWPNVNVEPDHNSDLWLAARSYYVLHAAGKGYRWSWRNAQLEWNEYRQSIEKKNDAGHDATHFLGLILANHLLSTVDAFVTLRLRGGVGASRNGYQLTATFRTP